MKRFRFAAIWLAAMLVFSLIACSHAENLMTEEPSSEKEAAELYQKLMQKEEEIQSEAVELWEKLFLSVDKDNLSITDNNNYGDFLLKIIEDARDQFSEKELQTLNDGAEQIKKIEEKLASLEEKYPDCAVTLSIGEKKKASYLAFFNAGADRYLLRHETATDEHYRKLHPENLSLENRKRCLFDLKDIGYQVGAGFMVGSPYQTTKNLVNDLLFLKELNPHMIGIGPYISQQDTPFADMENGTLEQTLFLLGILRVMFPNVLLPSTTALGTIAPNGRELGLRAGANVVMPNLSPVSVRKKYQLYDNKICTGEESAQCAGCLRRRIESVGYEMTVSRGDFKRSK